MSYRSSVEFSGALDADLDPDIVYYNADIINDNALNPVAVGQDPVVRFQETRSTALVKNISNFYFSIVRFTMNGPNKDLPLFIPSIQLGQSDLDLTSYSLGINWNESGFTWGGFSTNPSLYAQGFVKYISETIAYQSFNVPLPNAPISSQDIRGPYYYVYTYQHWLDRVNTTSADLVSGTPIAPNAYYPNGNLAYQFFPIWAVPAAAQVVATFSALPAPAVGNNGQTWGTTDTRQFYVSNGSVWTLTPLAIPQQNQPPTFQYDPNTGLFTLYTPSGYLYASPASLTPTTFTLWFNTNMFGLFTNFNNRYTGNEPTGQVNQIVIQNLLGTNKYTDDASLVWYKTTQDYNSTSSLWSPISAIVFTSTLIPVFPENTGQPIVYGAGNDVANQNNSTSAFQPIITDIALPLNKADDYRGFIEYVPTAEYRLSAFTSSKQELRNIDVQVFWKARLDNNLYPVRMFNQSSVSIKMMFRKKSAGLGKS